MTLDLHGIIPYLVTPVDQPSGRLREHELGRLVEHLLAAGVHGLSPLGSTGEFASLPAEVRLAAVRAVVHAAAGAVPVVPGVAAAGTADAVAQATAYVEAGASGIVLIFQPYFPVSEAEAVDYYRGVAEAIDRPIVLYENPLLGPQLSLTALEQLAELPSVRYLKDASPNTGRLLSVSNRLGGRLGLFAASAHVPLFVLELGGRGWMAGPACVAPALSVELLRRWEAGDRPAAWDLQRRLWHLNELFQRYSLAPCIKAALEELGFQVGAPIHPQRPLRGAALDEIRRALATLELL
ncbi:MAG: dihydrodipicolinate synthase family protein [Candidatus Dormibacteraeota bacterium]|nr:dihydrodipicolinate synthase family protein [Candidatus Dormibacteraeota bacterium]